MVWASISMLRKIPPQDFIFCNIDLLPGRIGIRKSGGGMTPALGNRGYPICGMLTKSVADT